MLSQPMLSFVAKKALSDFKAKSKALIEDECKDLLINAEVAARAGMTEYVYPENAVSYFHLLNQAVYDHLKDKGYSVTLSKRKETVTLSW